MRFGVNILPEDRWPTARQKWRLAEQLGFDHAWTCDHLNWRMFRSRDWFTAVPTLSAAALVTERIRLGVLVASPNLRHPVQLAKDVATVEDLASGRLILGLGAGTTGFDATMTRRVPWTRRERAERFEEYVRLTDLLLTQRVCTFDGRYYVATDVHSYPPCRQQPRVPFAIAAAGPRGLRLAAQDGQFWVTTGEPQAFESAPYEAAVPVIERQVEAFDQACLEVGRDPATVARVLVAGPTIGGVLASKEAFFDAAARFEEIGITDLVVQWPRTDEPFAAEVMVLEEIAGSLG